MEDKLKAAAAKSREELKELQDELFDVLEDIPEELEDVKKHLDSAFARISTGLEKSIDKAAVTSEEAQLQAHLGIMEAKDKLDASSKVVDHYLDKKRDQSANIIDELELKAHLARMEAEDFWEQKGPGIKREFEESKEAMAEQAQKAIDELQSQFKKWRNTLSR